MLMLANQVTNVYYIKLNFSTNIILSDQKIIEYRVYSTELQTIDYLNNNIEFSTPINCLYNIYYC